MRGDRFQTTEFRQLTGQETSHLCEVVSNSGVFRLSRLTAAAFCELAKASRAQGYELAIASAHRNFDRQLLIWNEKAAGIRPVLDENGDALNVEQLSDRDRVMAILRWSALPGMSRHHWGTDIDIYDAAAMNPGYQVQLTPSECCHGGRFSALHQWLDDSIQRGRSCGFYRPYAFDRGGVAPEPWHLSFAPEAAEFELMLDPASCHGWLASQPIALRAVVLANFDEIYERFIAPAQVVSGG